jgi:hypothetical protein
LERLPRATLSAGNASEIAFRFSEWHNYNSIELTIFIISAYICDADVPLGEIKPVICECGYNSEAMKGFLSI